MRHLGVVVRREEQRDWEQVEELVKAAFENIEVSDQSEHELVAALRHSENFVKELSLVAEHQNELAGHILLTEIEIINTTSKTKSLALAPVSVLPKHQSKGVGIALIEASHDIARKLGYTSVVLVGHEAYYPRFGYKKASSFGISVPFEVPDENVMALELVQGALKSVKGTVKYAIEFGL